MTGPARRQASIVLRLIVVPLIAGAAVGAVVGLLLPAPLVATFAVVVLVIAAVLVVQTERDLRRIRRHRDELLARYRDDHD